MLKLILSNNEEIEVKEGSTIFDIMVEQNLYISMWKQLTQDNLKTVSLTTEDGDCIDKAENLVLNSETSVKIKDEIVCHFYLREKTAEELLREKVAFLEEQLAVHDGAISDMGEAISGLAEAGGLA